MEQDISAVWGSVIPTHHFLVVDEVCGWTLSKHFPICEKDVPEGLIMWVIGHDEEDLSSTGDFVDPNWGKNRSVLLFPWPSR